MEGSCWQCKDQRVLCKLEKPTCSQCQKVGRQCQYGSVRLRWGNGVASRGRNAGRNAPLAKGPKPVMPDQWQIAYFAHELLPLFSLRDNGPTVNSASIANDPLLSQAVVAVSNAHCLSRSSDPGQEAAIVKAQNRLAVIKVFRQHLMVASVHVSVPAVFLANVILCILDGMIEPNQDEDTTHLHFFGGRAILQRFECLDVLFSVKQGVPAVMLSIFAMGDLTQSLLSGDDPYFRSKHWLKFKGNEAWWTWTGDQDSFPEIMASMARLAHMGHQTRDSGASITTQELIQIQDALSRTEPPCAPCFSTVARKSDVSAHRDHDATWAAFCSAYRAAALIYTYRALCNLDVHHDLVQQAVRAGFEATCDTEYPGKLAHCLLFPLLIVGTHCIHADQRKKVRETVCSTGAYLSFGCVRVMDAFLAEVWSGQGERVDWWTRFDGISRSAFIF